ncbi:hypothetical protein ACFL2O_09520 [Thermodesulfobacteriota bacterium]
MRDGNQGFAQKVIAVFFLFLFIGCTTIPHLKVNYRLPPGTDVLKGKKVVLVTEDARTKRDILTPRAYEAFKNFPGNISFSVTKHNGAPFDIGLYEPLSMFKEALKRRLQIEGIDVRHFSSDDEIELIFVLNKFDLDLVSRKWIAEMSCEVKMMRGKQFLASQSLSGRGEHLKMLGTDEADKIMGDVFTDLINRVDVAGLFRRANLL